MDKKKSLEIKIIERSSRLIVGAMLLLSGFAKAFDSGAFADLLARYGYPSLIWFSPVIIIVEIAAGLCLLLRINPKRTAALSVAMIVVFSIVFLYARLTGKVMECGCFGVLKKLELSPVGTFIRNACMVVLLFFVWKFSNYSNRETRFTYSVVTITLLVGSFICGYSFTDKAESRNQHPMFERAVSETAIPEFMHISNDSTYLVFIFSYRCQSCWNYFDNVKRYYDSELFDNITVFMGGRDSLQDFYSYFKPEFALCEMDEKELTRIARTAPTMYFIQNDTVKYVIEGSIPTYYMFNQNYLIN